MNSGLEDNSRYQSQTSVKRKKQDGDDENPAGKPLSEKKLENKKKSRPRKVKRSREASSKKESELNEEKKSKKSNKSEKKLMKSENKNAEEWEELFQYVVVATFRIEEKPLKFKKFRKPWKNMFKMKNRRKEYGSPTERCGTWA